VIATLDAAVPPILVTVSVTTTFPPLRVSSLVTIRFAGVAGAAAGFMVIVVDAVAEVKSAMSVGVKVTESVWSAPGDRTVPAGGL
jgi:hypothetical protein